MADMQSMGSGQLGSGLANNAAALLQYREPYTKMAMQMQMEGQQPPPFEQWATEQLQASQPRAEAAPQPMDRRAMLAQAINQLPQQGAPQGMPPQA